jgi:[pyruvate, water dikinase]-phosphate phosphotransferase / [pyruvate, water dikinase] kinase
MDTTEAQSATKTRRKQAPPAPERRKGPWTIYILSDSTGNLARHMISTFLTQFDPAAFRVHPVSFLQTERRLSDALQEIRQTPGIVFHAVVATHHKQAIEAACQEVSAPCMDLTGPFVQFLSDISGLPPRNDQRLLHSVDEAYHRRIRALEFTIEHDDGLGLDTLFEADIVLTGVSRTGKTPTSIFLSQQGFRVANVSLAMGVEPPRELINLPRNRVIGLWIDPHILSEIRNHRSVSWQMAPSAYSDPGQIEEEIKWSRKLFARQGWHTLDITNQAIEETAGRIISLLGLGASTF